MEDPTYDTTVPGLFAFPVLTEDQLARAVKFREGEAAIPGFLEDYAFFAQALLDLYETQFDIARLDAAAAIAAKMVNLFEDPAAGGFYSAAASADLVMRVKEDYDGAEPSGNSVAVFTLLRLARITNRREFRESAGRRRLFCRHTFRRRLA